MAFDVNFPRWRSRSTVPGNGASATQLLTANDAGARRADDDVNLPAFEAAAEANAPTTISETARSASVALNRLLSLHTNGEYKTFYEAGAFHQGMTLFALGTLNSLSAKILATQTHTTEQLLGLVQQIEKTQNEDGGFGHLGASSRIDVTRVVVLGLEKVVLEWPDSEAAARAKKMLPTARDYLRSSYNTESSYTYTKLISDVLSAVEDPNFKEGIVSVRVWKAANYVHQMAPALANPASSGAIAAVALILDGLAQIQKNGFFGSGGMAPPGYDRYAALDQLVACEDGDGGTLYTAFLTSLSLVAAVITLKSEEVLLGKRETTQSRVQDVNQKASRLCGGAVSFLQNNLNPLDDVTSQSWTAAGVWDTATFMSSAIQLAKRADTPAPVRDEIIAKLEQSLSMLVAAKGNNGRFAFTPNGKFCDNDSTALVLHCMASALPLLKEGQLKSDVENCIQQTFTAFLRQQRINSAQEDYGAYGAYGTNSPPPTHMNARGEPIATPRESYGQFGIDVSFVPGAEYNSMVYDFADPGLTSRVLAGLFAALKSGVIDTNAQSEFIKSLPPVIEYFDKVKSGTEAQGYHWWSRWLEGDISNGVLLPLQLRSLGTSVKDETLKKQVLHLLQGSRAYFLAEPSTDDPLQIAFLLLGQVTSALPDDTEVRESVKKLAKRLTSAMSPEGTWACAPQGLVSYGKEAEKYNPKEQNNNLIASALLLADDYLARDLAALDDFVCENSDMSEG